MPDDSSPGFGAGGRARRGHLLRPRGCRLLPPSATGGVEDQVPAAVQHHPHLLSPHTPQPPVAAGPPPHPWTAAFLQQVGPHLLTPDQLWLRVYEQANYQVEFVLDFDPATQSALIIGLYNEENNINNQTLGLPQLMNGSNVLTVPGGVYDILVAFDGYDHDRVVIREQVEISENMQLNFAASEATNHIRFQTLTADGEPIFTGIGGFDENWNYVQLQPSNADEVVYQKKIYCMDCGEIFLADGNFGMITEDENVDPLTLYTHADFFVNDVSDR